MYDQKDTPRYIQFLSNHPAILSEIQSDIFSAGCFWTYNCSAEDETECDPVFVYRDDEKFKKFKSQFRKDDDHILVSYKDYYNKNWVYDHTKYYGEVTIKMFQGNFSKVSDRFDVRKWMAYQGVRAKGKTFDEMIKNLHDEVLNHFGDFCYNDDSMLTAGEKENHQKEPCFTREKIIKNGRKFNALNINKKHLSPTMAMFNRRWLQWYAGSVECQESWGEEFSNIVNKTPKWVFDLTLKPKGKK